MTPDADEPGPVTESPEDAEAGPPAGHTTTEDADAMAEPPLPEPSADISIPEASPLPWRPSRRALLFGALGIGAAAIAVPIALNKSPDSTAAAGAGTPRRRIRPWPHGHRRRAAKADRLVPC